MLRTVVSHKVRRDEVGAALQLDADLATVVLQLAGRAADLHHRPVALVLVPESMHGLRYHFHGFEKLTAPNYRLH